MLLFAVGFNFWLYRLEPTATVDPNDNAFQFGLVDRTNTMWDFATKKCSSSFTGIITFPVCHFLYLADHWVPNWAEGYNLPFYYSHVPQILIVGSWRFLALFAPQLTLFHYYHIVIYILLCIFPAAVFWALLLMDLPWLTAGIGALIASNLSTDGLYGLDPSSFLWRGYGLSSQLFAMIWLPLAIAYSYRFFMLPKEEVVVSGKQFIEKLKTTFITIARGGALFRAIVTALAKKNLWSKNGPVLDDARTTARRPTRDLLWAIFYVTATTAGHLGIGMIAMLSIGFLAIGIPVVKFLRQEPLRDVWDSLVDQIIRLILVVGISIFLLSYWIVPVFLQGNYHNISFWDPVWKFNSYGIKETMIRLFDGDLFDFGRGPYITLLTLLGVLVCLLPTVTKRIVGSVLGITEKTKDNKQLAIIPNTPTLSPLSFLFIFWLLFYFGRTTWGSLIDMIPGMKDFHLSRFLVGVHVAGMLLSPIGFAWLAEYLSGFVDAVLRKVAHTRLNYVFIRLSVYLFMIVIIIPRIYQWSVTYNQLNEQLILRANTSHAAVASDEQALFAKLRSLAPGRIYAGRGGSYGKNFKVAETPYFMNLSTYGLQTTMWLPETWSMNSDTEQDFSEDALKDYDLYNIRWAAAPPDEPPKSFWKLIDQSPTWKLYEIPTSGYFTVGVRPAIVSIGRQSFMNLVHLWIQSNDSAYGLYPEMTFDTSYPHATGLPNFKMTDEADYITPDGKTHGLFSEPPVYLPPGFESVQQLAKVKREQYNDMKLLGPEVDDTDMIFKTNVEVGANCPDCIVVLKETFHPNWRVTVDGKSVKPFIVFPFFIGIPVAAGTHTIVAWYEPSKQKVFLLWVTILAVVICALPFIVSLRKKK